MTTTRTFLVILINLSFSILPIVAHANPPSGIATLQTSSTVTTRNIIPEDTRALLSPSEQEEYLSELENVPPTWKTLHTQPGEEQGERLFRFNRARDTAREGHPLLTQRIGFLWSGILRTFNSEHQGFTVAMGPELTHTSWGIMRFKPVGLPDEMIAVPRKNLLLKLKSKISQGEEIEVTILFFGKLVPNESIMYGFSHDGNEEGMIMPFVQIDQVNYILR